MDRRNKIFIDVLARLISGMEKSAANHQIYRPDKSACVPAQRNAVGTHYHESWELKIPVRGHMRCRLDGQDFDLEQHAALLIAPQSLHPETVQADVHRKGIWLNLLFESGDVRLMLMAGRRVTLYFLSSDQKSELTGLLGKPANEFCEHIALVLERMKKSDGRRMANKWFSIFFSALLHALASPPVSSPQHEIISRTIALLNNMSNDSTLTVGRMAKMLNISPKYLSAVFHRLTGVTPRQKLIRIRLEKAYRQLQTGRFSVKETAGLTGWRNQFYFSNSFRRHYGIAPSRVPIRMSKS